MMHKRFLHSSIARSAKAVKKPYKFTPATVNPGYRRDDPALNDSQRYPVSPRPVTKVFPPFNTEEVIEQQRRLAETSPGQASSSPLDDNSATEYTTPILDDGEYLPELSFDPGTFVEVRRSAIVTEGVVLREHYMKGWKIDVLTTTGEMFPTNRTDAHFCIPNFVSSDLAARCGEGVVPENPTQINARVEVLKQLRVFSLNVEKSVEGSHMWNRQIRLNLYDEVKAKDSNKWSEVSLRKATSLLYLNPNPINYYATHKYLTDRPLRYVAKDGYFRSQIFSVRPQQEVDEILMVDKLIKEYRIGNRDGKYFQFVQKAKEVIAKWDFDPMLQKGHISQDTSAPNWNEDDQLFLRFLLRSQQNRRSNQLDPYEIGCQTFIRDITSSPSITEPIYREVLIKLGVIAPWQSYVNLSTEVNPTGDLNVSDSLQTAGSKFLKKSQRISGNVLGPYDLHGTDPLEAVRQDHHRTVFVIDDAEAEELDDGISVERIPSEPGHVWVHIHVADPARYLHPRHVLSLRARQQSESFYFVAKSYPLFPSEMMYDPAAPMSLSSSKRSKEANRVVTISVKLDGTGDLVDYKLQASILRDVRVISYDNVDAALGNTDHVVKYPFGKPGTPKAVRESLSHKEVADLRLLFKLTELQEKRRFKQNILIPSLNRAEPRLVRPIPSAIQSPYLQGATYHGFPEIEYPVKSSLIQGARGMVAEMMKLAGQAASCIARDRGIPLIRRGMGLSTYNEGLEQLLAMRHPSGGVPYEEMLKVQLAQAPTTVGIELMEHSFMGIPATDGYSRVTSPLRRYADLVGHWQLHHILLGPNAPRRLPFDKADMEMLARESSVKNRTIKSLGVSDASFWSILAIKRLSGVSSHFGKSMVDHSVESPLSSMRGFVRAIPMMFNFEFEVQVYLPDLGLSGVLRGATGLTTGDEVQVRVKEIELGRYPRLLLERI